MVCACAEDTQTKLFKKVLREANFDAEHFVPVDVRNATNDGILGRIRERLNQLANPQKPRD
jgi:hypothetical protein